MSSVKKVWYAPYMNQSYGEEEIEAVNKCLRAGWLAPGPLTAEFEQKIIALFGKACGLMVNSGSSANMLAVICANAVNGAEVITPACTFSTTVAPLAQNGAKIIFCDVEKGRYVPSVEQVMKVLTPQTKVILIPNLLGDKPDWAELRRQLDEKNRQDIILIEDSCDTITYTGDVTDITTTSFYASHIITAGGTGGMVMFNTKNAKMLERATRIRDWGRVGTNTENFADRFKHTHEGSTIAYDFKFYYCEFGYNFKACEMNAAFGLAQLKKFEGFRQKRHVLRERYLDNLSKDKYAKAYYEFPNRNPEIMYLALPLTCQHRMELLEFLEKNEVQTRVTMAGNILRHPIFDGKFTPEELKQFPVADDIMEHGFLVGCHHGMDEADVDRVSDLLIKFANEHKDSIPPAKLE